jgi:hypothetical protein
MRAKSKTPPARGVFKSQIETGTSSVLFSLEKHQAPGVFRPAQSRVRASAAYQQFASLLNFEGIDQVQI